MTAQPSGPKTSRSWNGFPPHDPDPGHSPGSSTTAHRTSAGGRGKCHTTVQVPSSATVANGEISHRGEWAAPAEDDGCCCASTTINAPNGLLVTVPLKVYRLPGGGGTGLPVQDRIPILAPDAGIVDEGRIEEVGTGSVVGSGEGGVFCWTLTKATMILATAATSAASRVCQRSSGQPRILTLGDVPASSSRFQLARMDGSAQLANRLAALPSRATAA
jgi:hypothetical protein